MDHVLLVRFPASRPDLEERVRAALYLSASRGDFTEEAGDELIVNAYFASADDRTRTREVLSGIGGVVLEQLDRPEADWLERYEQSLLPILVGQRFVVAPSADLFPAGDRLRLIVPQEHAFGTGSHESTALCMEMLEETPLQDRTGLDIGTGSGILAMAMILLGARHVVAFDNDPETIAVVPMNRRRNGLDESALLQFCGGVEVLRAGQFDVATMNILPEVIIPLLPTLVPRLSAGGSLIVSGILEGKASLVIQAAEGVGLRLQRETTRGEWWCGLLRSR